MLDEESMPTHIVQGVARYSDYALDKETIYVSYIFKILDFHQRGCNNLWLTFDCKGTKHDLHLSIRLSKCDLDLCRGALAKKKKKEHLLDTLEYVALHPNDLCAVKTTTD